MNIKNTLTTFLLIAHSAALISCEPSGMGERGAKREKIIERFDRDGDGKLSEDERAAARNAKEKVQLIQAREETAARLTPEQRERLKERFDKNGDGTLDDEERASARRALMMRRQAQEK